ncbi:MAG: putative Alkanesulfonate monooxygenase [Bacteroidota bacterium]|nr:putative Alkanesulfonate monooxygenase [Bacteroidota bacterium]
MKIDLPDRVIDVFTISPRTLDVKLYWENIKNTIRLSEKYGYSGNLIFTGNDIYVDTWLVAQTLFSDTQSLSPLIAVNPLYMHPFSAAKMISSFAYIFGRKSFINCVTGTSKNDMQSFNDNLEHDDRYKRLEEYIEIIKLLLTGEPVSYSGNFYVVNNMQLLPKIPEALQPEFYVAGASAAAKMTAIKVGAVHIMMGKPLNEISSEYPSFIKQEGVYFGIVTRETEPAAWEFVCRLFPENEEGEMMLEYSMTNTDSEWKKELKSYAEAENATDKRYWMKPFKGFQADCPYYVGDYVQIADVIASYVLSGVKSIIIDTPSDEKEYIHIANAFKKAKEKITHTHNVSQTKFDIKFNF